jgi:hypothetical protein
MPKRKTDGFMQDDYSLFAGLAKDALDSISSPYARLLAYEVLTPRKYGLNGGWSRAWFCKQFKVGISNFKRQTTDLFEKEILAFHDGYIFYNPRFAYKGTKYWHYRCQCWDLGVAFKGDQACLGEIDDNGNLLDMTPEYSEAFKYEGDD